MRSALLALSVLITFGSGAVQSQTIQVVMSADEVEKELLGVHFSGVTGFQDEPWSECIEPDGDTVFNHAGRQSVGRVTIRSDGLACFIYDGVRTDQNCYSVSRFGPDGYEFNGLYPGTNFLAT